MSEKKIFLPDGREITVGDADRERQIELQQEKAQLAQQLFNDFKLRTQQVYLTGDSTIDSKINEAIYNTFYKLTTGAMTDLTFLLVGRSGIDTITIGQRELVDGIITVDAEGKPHVEPAEMKVVRMLQRKPYEAMIVADTAVITRDGRPIFSVEDLQKHKAQNNLSLIFRLWIITRTRGFVYMLPLKPIISPQEGERVAFTVDNLNMAQFYEFPIDQMRMGNRVNIMDYWDKQIKA